jgi:hypothetical protein
MHWSATSSSTSSLGRIPRGDKRATLRRVRARLTAFLAVALVATTAACGGGGPGDDRLSQEEFRKQANAICDKYDSKIQALGSPSSAQEVSGFVDRVIPLLQQGISELRALKPPEEAEDDYDRMLDETEKAVPAAQKLADAAEKNDAAALQEALDEARNADQASDEIATKLGLTGCASSE